MCVEAAWERGGQKEGREGETAGECVWSCRSGLIGTFCSWGILICCGFDAVGCSAVAMAAVVELAAVVVVVVVAVVVVVEAEEELSNGREGRKPEIASNSEVLCDGAYNGFLHSYARLKLGMQLKKDEGNRGITRNHPSQVCGA